MELGRDWELASLRDKLHTVLSEKREGRGDWDRLSALADVLRAEITRLTDAPKD